MEIVSGTKLIIFATVVSWAPEATGFAVHMEFSKFQ